MGWKVLSFEYGCDAGGNIVNAMRCFIIRVALLYELRYYTGCFILEGDFYECVKKNV